jgi:hypothetical protein
MMLAGEPNSKWEIVSMWSLSKHAGSPVQAGAPGDAFLGGFGQAIYPIQTGAPESIIFYF